MTLQELYDKIKDLDPIPLVPEVIDSGNIKDYIVGVMSSGEFIINNPVVVALPSEDDIQEITIVGDTASYGLGINFPVELSFVTKFNELYLDLRSDFIEQSLAMPGVSWFAVSDLNASMEVYDADQLNKGSYNGQISLLPGVVFSMDYPIVNSTWVFNANLENPVGLSDLIALCNGASLIESLPPPMKTFADLRVTRVGMSYNAETSVLEYMDLSVSSQTEWQILPQLALKQIALEATILDPAGSNSQVKYTVSGDFQIGEPETTNGLMNITASMPNLQIYGGLQPGSELFLLDLLKLFLPGVTSENYDSKFTVFKFLADPTNTNYTLNGDLEANWELLTIDGLVIELYTISANLQYLNGNTTGGLSGVIVLQDKGEGDIDEITMEIAAEHPKAGDDWTFSGKLADGSSIDVKKLLARFLGIDLLPEGSEITINSLDTVVHSTSTDYSFKVSVNWGNLLGEGIPLTISDTTLNISSKDDKREGFISGTASLVGVDLKLEYHFSDDPEKANIVKFIIFGITSELNVTDKEKVLTVTPGDQSVGDIITMLVNAASPGSGITLPKPWDVLNTISLEGFTFIVNFTQKKVGFTYDINTNLGFVNISKINLFYSFASDGKDKKVEIGLEGSFLGQAMPPAWDVLDPDSAPKVPGKGNGKFDLQFLGMGQHVGMNEPLPSTVIEGVDNMIKAFKDPPKEGTSLYFDSSINWLVGTRFVVMNMVNIDALFYDPLLYGLSISVSGGKFEGLDFEILYKKVSDNVGVYQILLSLPTFIRQMEFGAVTVTLPNVGVWIYTNGDFKLDFGFPKDGDFSGSFGIQLLPFVGAGGFYFGILSTETADQLPANYNPDCGDFDPVIVFGLGLRLGLGKSIDKGILKAELSLTIQGIIEGTLAFFNAYPDETGVLPADTGDRPIYYYIQGQIALVGKIFGEINFAIISATLDLKVAISARAVIEAYEATMINFTASVSVSLKVKVNLGIFSISIRLSFETSITESFTLGSGDPNAPWNCTSQQSALRSPVLLSLTDDNACATIPEMNWQPVYLETGDPAKSVPLYYASQFSMSSDTLGVADKAKNLVGVAMMYIGSNAYTEGENPPFSIFARGVLTWVLNAYYNKDVEHPTEADVLDKTVTQDDLRQIYCYLSQADDTANKDFEPFTYDNIIGFLANYFEFVVSLPPTEEVDDEETETGIFPVFPLFSLTTPSGTSEFGANASIQFTREELNEIKAYFKQLNDGLNDQNTDIEDAIVEETQSLANYIFVDYFTMIAKSSVQSALDKMQVLEQEVPTKHSMSSLSNRFPISGISLEEFAFTNRLHKLKPSVKLVISGAKYTYKEGDDHKSIAKKFGFTIKSIEQGEVNRTYRKGRTIELPDFKHQVGENENLRSIAGRYRMSVRQLAIKNSNLKNLFDNSRRIKFANVESINAGELLTIMEEQFVFNNLSGLSARVLLQGLRPIGPKDSIYDGIATPFYALSLQEFDASALAIGDQLTLSLTDETPLDWLKLGDGVSIDMPVTEELIGDLDKLKAATFNPVIQELAPLNLASIRPKNFTLPTQISWKRPDQSLDDGTSDPSIWPLSADLINLLQIDKSPYPTIKLFTQVQEHENIAPPPIEVPNPGWAMKLEVKISRIPGSEKTMYEMLGTGQADSTLLEELLTYYDANKTEFIKSIDVLYSEEPAQPDQQAPPIGLQSDPQENVNLFLIQSNLSTVSNPPPPSTSPTALDANAGLLGQTPIEFLKLLWECSITASGGYYFYYESAEGGISLPDYLFNDDPNASITLLVNLNLANGIPGFVNAAVLEETIDTSEELLFAQVNFASTTLTMDEGDSLNDLKKKYFTDIYTIGNQNPNAKLTSKHELNIPIRKYQVQDGKDVDRLSKQFKLSKKAIIKLNGGKINWTPEVGSWILLPELKHKLGRSIGLSQFVEKYAVRRMDFLHMNADVPGLFIDAITFDNRVEEKISNVPNGSVGFTLQRQDPSLVTDIYQQQLLELYNLLEFNIEEAGIFDASNPAIPAGPTDEEAPVDLDQDKSFAVPELNDEPWKFEGVVPAYRFVKDIPLPTAGLPNPEDNPYNAISGETQENVTINFAWNDIFGNTLAIDSNKSAANTWPTLSIPIGYTDQIISVSQWRNVLPRYSVQLVDEVPELIVNYRFQADRYTDIADPEAKKENAATEAKLYQLIYYQLSQKDVKVSFSTSMDGTEPSSSDSQDIKEDLIDFVASIYAFLTNIAEGKTPVTPDTLTINWSIADLNPENVFLFEVAMHISRNILLVADEFKDQLSSSQVRSTIKPDLDSSSASISSEVIDEPLSLTDFATVFQSAFPELKVLTGPPNTKSDEAQDEIWLARFNKKTNGIWMSVANAGQPNYYAVKPLAVNLISDPEMMVFPYQSGKVICKESLISNPVNSVDMELMASAFLSAVDQFLSADYAIKAWLNEQNSGSLGDLETCLSETPYDSLIGSKKSIASAISENLLNIFTDNIPTAENLAQAREVLHQELLIQLSNAYEINTVVQFDNCVQANVSLPANLYGKAVSPSVEGDTTDVPYALNSSKVSLPTTGEDSCLDKTKGNKNLTFTFSAANPSEQAFMELDLDYVISAMEVNIREVPGIEDYKASDWLSFVLPFKVSGLSTGLGELDIPIPLKIYPTPPSVLSQGYLTPSQQSDVLNGTPEEELEDSKKWLYNYTYNYKGASQDTIDANVLTNVEVKNLNANRLAEEPDLFTALIQFTYAYPDIQNDLNHYLIKNGDPEKAYTAIQSFAWLVSRVANAWGNWETDKVKYQTMFENKVGVDFQITQQAYTPTDLNQALADEQYLLVEVSSDQVVQLPHINIEGFNPVSPNKAIKVQSGSVAQYIYQSIDDPKVFLSYEIGKDIPNRTIQMTTEYDVLEEENATGGISIIRNQDLGSNRKVNNDFIYRTPEIRMINPVIPLLRPKIVINLADYSPSGQNDLAVYLTNFFKSLFVELIPPEGEVQRIINFKGSYSYLLVSSKTGDGEDFRTKLPIFLTTPYEFNIPEDWGLDNEDAFVNLIANDIIAWFNTHKPKTTGGLFQFDLSLFSNLTDSNLPILTYENIELDISLISDLEEN